MKWSVKCLGNYTAFKARAGRAEFWYDTLFVALLLAPTLFGPAVGMIVRALALLVLPVSVSPWE